MTDEELGRKWAERHGTKLVVHEHVTGANVTEGLHWQDEQDDEFLHPAVRAFLDYDDYFDEAEANDDLGAALRKLLAFADGVREVMG